VNINPQPWETLMEKIQADIRSGAPTVDIFWSDLEFAYTLWPNLLPLNDFIESTGYPMDGFFPSVAEYGLGIGGQEGVRYGLPIMTDTQLCWYRSDMIENFPTTWDEYEQMLKEFTGGDQYGLGNSGVVAQGIGRFLSRYWSIPGATLLDEDWNPRINSEEGVFALEMYRRQATSYSPPGFQAWEYTDAVNAFLNGDVVVHEGWPEVMLPWLNDPERNQVVGENWGAAAYPEGGAAQLVQHNLILFNTAKNPEAAFNFMAYCTDRDMAKRIINDYNVDSPRQDVWEEVLPENPVAQKFFPSWSSAMQVARPFARHLPQWLELFISIGEAVTATVAGTKTAQEALDETAERWSQSIEKAKPDFPYQEVVGI
jgi:ABC-type glycerol-3-phosphate transport system substrate-binding protein